MNADFPQVFGAMKVMKSDELALVLHLPCRTKSGGEKLCALSRPGFRLVFREIDEKAH